MKKNKNLHKKNGQKARNGAARHFAQLKKRYHQVGKITWLNHDLQQKKIDKSRELFTPESLKRRRPVPKALEVHACLSGLPFPKTFTNKLVAVQKKIAKALGQTLHYWVAPRNLGLEYCVFKWPADSWNKNKTKRIRHALAAIPKKSFVFLIKGVQINPDGCVVAKGFDQNAGVFKIRNELRQRIPFMPKKQSKWAHVPLGRILEPMGKKRFFVLKKMVSKILNIPIARTKISTIKYIHEKQWYMERRKILSEYFLEKD